MSDTLERLGADQVGSAFPAENQEPVPLSALTVDELILAISAVHKAWDQTPLDHRLHALVSDAITDDLQPVRELRGRLSVIDAEGQSRLRDYVSDPHNPVALRLSKALKTHDRDILRIPEKHTPDSWHDLLYSGVDS